MARVIVLLLCLLVAGAAGGPQGWGLRYCLASHRFLSADQLCGLASARPVQAACCRPGGRCGEGSGVPASEPRSWEQPGCCVDLVLSRGWGVAPGGDAAPLPGPGLCASTADLASSFGRPMEGRLAAPLPVGRGSPPRSYLLYCVLRT